MARHGGYPMGMGGNMQQLVRQAQKMQENMQKKQEELNSQIFTATAGGGMVTANVFGSKKLESIVIDPKCVDPDDIEMLQDLVLTAVNSALDKVTEISENELGKLTGGMGLGF